LLRYILKRVVWLVVMLLMVFFITFTILSSRPGSWLHFLSEGEPTGGAAKALDSVGLYGTLIGDFLLFMLRYAVRLDFAALLSRSTIGYVMLPMRVKYTLILCVSAVIVSWLVGMPLGIAAATNRGRRLDNVITSMTVALGSMPSFWVGLMLLLLFGGVLHMVSMLFGGVKSLILPIVALSVCNIPIVTAATRAGLLETLDKDFIVTVRAKGVRERLVVWRHAVRNSMLPLMSILGNQLTKAFGGALIIEIVFSVPGVGSMMYDAINRRDFLAEIICILISAALSGVINLVADIAYTAINPAVRQRYE